MKSKLLLLTGMLCIMLLGCNAKDKYELPSGSIKSKYYVTTYVVADDIQLSNLNENSVQILFKGVELHSTRVSSKQPFEELAATYQDGAYNGMVIPYSNQALSEALTSIDVICDRDYDDEHTAGQSLYDIVQLCASSPHKYIQNGYKEVGQPEELPDYWYPFVIRGRYSPVMKLLNEVNSDNSKLLYPLCYLYFTKNPTVGGEYTFTVTVNVGDKVITKNIKHSFI